MRSEAVGSLLVFGDSISVPVGVPPRLGWTTLLDERLRASGASCPVVNCSIGGRTTEEALHQLPTVLDEVTPRWVVLQLGANDGFSRTAPALVGSNLVRLISIVRLSGREVLLVGMNVPASCGRAYAREFLWSYYQVAKETRVPLVPHILKGVATDPQLMQDDGLHPNAAGQPALLDNIWPKLEDMLVRGGIAMRRFGIAPNALHADVSERVR